VIGGDREALQAAAALSATWASTAAVRERERAVPEPELSAFAASGLGAITVPRAFGGADVSTLTLVAVIATIGAADPSLAQIPQNHFMGVDNLSWAAPETKALFYGELLNGARFGSAVSERGGRRYETRTTIVPDAGGFRVNGTKYYCTGALTADWIRVAGKHPDGQTCVALIAAGTPGLTVESDWAAFGQRVTHSGTTRVEDVWVPAVQVVLWNTEPIRSLLSFAISQVIHAAIEAGIATGALAQTLDLIRDGSVTPAVSGSELQAEIGRLAGRAAAARAIVARAARLTEGARGEETLQLADCQAAVIAVEEAKALAYDAAVSVTDAVMRLLGPAALDQRLGLDRHWRNARTHSLHDVVRWKYANAGDYFLNGRMPSSLGFDLIRGDGTRAAAPGR
jgi:alkylation response protein AidB-like acyl-CoA dehydrogenase